MDKIPLWGFFLFKVIQGSVASRENPEVREQSSSRQAAVAIYRGAAPPRNTQNASVLGAPRSIHSTFLFMWLGLLLCSPSCFIGCPVPTPAFRVSSLCRLPSPVFLREVAPQSDRVIARPLLYGCPLTPSSFLGLCRSSEPVSQALYFPVVLNTLFYMLTQRAREGGYGLILSYKLRM